jgi:hypothetical protein
MGVKLCLSYYEKNKDRMFENRAQRRILGPKRDEVIGARSKSFCRLSGKMYFLVLVPCGEFRLSSDDFYLDSSLVQGLILVEF